MYYIARSSNAHQMLAIAAALNDFAVTFVLSETFTTLSTSPLEEQRPLVALQVRLMRLQRHAGP